MRGLAERGCSMLSALMLMAVGVTSSAMAAEWEGTMSCGELQGASNTRARAAFKGKVTLRIESSNAVLDRRWNTGQEHLEGSVPVPPSGAMTLDGLGHFYGREAEGWRTRATLWRNGSSFQGTAVIVSRDGSTKFRDCTLSLPANDKSGNPQLPTAAAPVNAGAAQDGSTAGQPAPSASERQKSPLSQELMRLGSNPQESEAVAGVSALIEREITTWHRTPEFRRICPDPMVGASGLNAALRAIVQMELADVRVDRTREINQNLTWALSRCPQLKAAAEAVVRDVTAATRQAHSQRMAAVAEQRAVQEREAARQREAREQAERERRLAEAQKAEQSRRNQEAGQKIAAEQLALARQQAAADHAAEEAARLQRQQAAEDARKAQAQADSSRLAAARSGAMSADELAAQIRTKPVDRDFVGSHPGNEVLPGLFAYYSLDRFRENPRCQLELVGKGADQARGVRKWRLLYVKTRGREELATGVFFDGTPIRIYTDSGSSFFETDRDGSLVLNATQAQQLTRAKQIKLMHGYSGADEVSFIYDGAIFGLMRQAASKLCP